jgi:uncharacterized protein (TIGR00255 family)
MLKSMTGYGEGTVEEDHFALSVELKSVNNRFLKVNVKVPEEVSYLQNDLEAAVRNELSRGSVGLVLRFEPTHPADLYEIDEEVLKKYLNTLQRLSKEIARDKGSSEEIQLKDLLLMPGVIRTEEALRLGKEAVLPAARRAMALALERLSRMRRVEGETLEKDFRERSGKVGRLLDQVRKAAPQALEEYQRKLEERVNSLLNEKGVTLSPGDLLKEVAILAERSDITEEIERLASHLRQFIDSLDETEPVGRKLEFIAQEMFRETSTMSAKSSNTSLSQAIVEIKAEVDRMKEQVANVE